MGFILNIRSSPEAIELAGSKVQSLYQLQHLHINIPTWVAISGQAFNQFITQAGIQPLLDSHITQDNLAIVSKKIRKKLQYSELPTALLTELLPILNELEGPIVIRASGYEPENQTVTFSAQLHSFLGINDMEEILKHIQLCWISAFSEQALAYRIQHQLLQYPIRISVLIQSMVLAEKSGIAFSVNPQTKSQDELLVNAAYGLGKGVFSGLIDVDSYVINKKNITIKEHYIGEKAQILTLKGYKPLDIERQIKQVLSVTELKKISDIIIQVEQFKTTAHTIEWAIIKNKLWVLGVKSIPSSYEPILDPSIRIWNKSLSAHYQKITLPLSFSYMRQSHHDAMVEALAIVGISKEDGITAHSALPYLYGHFYGRVYDNLLVWDQILSLFPFTEKIQMLITQIAGNSIKVPIQYYRQLVTKKGGRSWFIQLKNKPKKYYQFIKMVLSTIYLVKQPLFKIFYEQSSTQNIEHLGSDQLVNLHQTFKQQTKILWTREIFIELTLWLLTMVVQQLSQRWFPISSRWVGLLLLNSIDSEETKNRKQHLQSLLQQIEKEVDFFTLIKTKDAPYLLTQLQQQGSEALKESIQQYLSQYDYQAKCPLQLNSYSLKQAPYELINLLILEANKQKVPDYNNQQILDNLIKKLPWRKRLLWKFVEYWVKKIAHTKAIIQLYRNKYFSISRQIFYLLGQQLSEQGYLQEAADIHYLYQDELYDLILGAISNKNLIALTKHRKQQYQQYEKLQLPGQLMTQGAVFNALQQQHFKQQMPLDLGQKLQGIACYSGIVRGHVNIVKYAEQFKGGILILLHLDQHWVKALSLASAILIEQQHPLNYMTVFAKEFAIPTVIQIPNLTQVLKPGDTIEVNGDLGTVQRIHEEKI